MSKISIFQFYRPWSCLNVVLQLKSLKHYYEVTHRQLLFNCTIFPALLQVRLLQVRPVPESKLLGIVVAELLDVGCPS